MKRASTVGNAHYVLLTAITVLGITYALPRVLLATLGMDNPWTSYFYLYGFGGLLFVIGMYMILRTRACQPGRGRDSFWLKMLIFGYLFYAGLHAAWLLAALYIPFKGAI